MTLPATSLDLLNRNSRPVPMLKLDCKDARVLSIASFLTLAISGMVLIFARTTLEYPIIHFVNLFSRRCAFVDYQLSLLSQCHLSSGIAFLSLIWYAWFRSKEPDYRARILIGTSGAALSGIFSRVLQLTLPSHLRPLHTPELAFLPPAGLDPDTLNHWNSFPSDHAAVLFGFATVIFFAMPKLGYFAFAWALVLNVTRVYLGLHFPTDISAGGAMGVLTVSLLLQQRICCALGYRLLSFERSAAPLFYAAAFLLSFQIGTLLDEVRSLASHEAHMVKAFLHR
jgi:membrane-associated phospholipid phosphatase